MKTICKICGKEFKKNDYDDLDVCDDCICDEEYDCEDIDNFIDLCYSTNKIEEF